MAYSPWGSEWVGRIAKRLDITEPLSLLFCLIINLQDGYYLLMKI